MNILNNKVANPAPDQFQHSALVVHKEDAYGPILGQLDDSQKYPIVLRVDDGVPRSILAVGDREQTNMYARGYILQAMKRRESIVAYDPTGELHAATNSMLREHGYKVRCTNGPDRINLLEPLRQAVRENNSEQYISSVMESILWQLDISHTEATLVKAVLYRAAAQDRADGITTALIRFRDELNSGASPQDLLGCIPVEDKGVRMDVGPLATYALCAREWDAYRKAFGGDRVRETLDSAIQLAQQLSPREQDWARDDAGALDTVRNLSLEDINGEISCAFFIGLEESLAQCFFAGAMGLMRYTHANWVSFIAGDLLYRRDACPHAEPDEDDLLPITPKSNTLSCVEPKTIKNGSGPLNTAIILMRPTERGSRTLLGSMAIPRKMASVQKGDWVVCLPNTQPIVASPFTLEMHDGADDPVLRAQTPPDPFCSLSGADLENYLVRREAAAEEYAKRNPHAGADAWDLVQTVTESIQVPDEVLKRSRTQEKEQENTKKLIFMTADDQQTLEAIAKVDNLSQAKVVANLLNSPQALVKAGFGRDEDDEKPEAVAHLVDKYQCMGSRHMTMEKSRAVLELVREVLDSCVLDTEKMSGLGSYFATNMARAGFAQDGLRTTEDAISFVEAMLSNIGDEKVYANDRLFRNLVVILQSCAWWFGGETSGAWYSKAKPVIEFVF